MNRCILRLSLLLVAVAAGLPAGCHKAPAPPEEPPLPVDWSYPVERVVTDHVDYTGRLDSINSVDIKPRVTGYLVKMPFKEGSEVKQDQILFEIDPRTYKATYDEAVASVHVNNAQYALAKANNARAKKVRMDNPAAISQQELDEYEAKEQVAKANAELTKAKQESALIYLNWCTVQAPIDGLISRYYLTVGNLANADTTLLTTIVSLNPIYAYFDMDERTLLLIRDAVLAGRLKYKRTPEQMASICVSSVGLLANSPNPWQVSLSAETILTAGELKVFMSLANEKGFPHEGSLNFINNKVNPLTGTINVRGVFTNPKGNEGVRLMSPGMFVRIHLPISEPYKALLVAQKVILTDQGLKNVFVIDKDDKIQYRRVELGAVQPDGLQVILGGLEPTDRIALTHLQFVRPPMKVAPKQEAMPIEDLPGQPNRIVKAPAGQPNEKK